MAKSNDDTCSRCGRLAPAVESKEILEWEADVDGRWICPGCLTPAEDQAITEDAYKLDVLVHLDPDVENDA